ncbi:MULTISPECIES: hypothetical protein [Bacillus cereus group]|uniref:Methyl-accepting chemotaxis protein n=1 Tax=Bacillus proteolyticus TaxID=2026192 RepID=A0ABV3ILA7_9BACI|nr:hypothetical protein [Bacillus cereus group sp. N8]MBJ8104843.1 hypothetical protein [Bacillus cereus group sp. N8]
MEKERKTFSYGLRIQLMLFTTVLAFITYSTSIFFIYVMYDYFQIYVSLTVYNIIFMLLGVVWSGILAYGAAIFLIKPLQKLEEAARKATELILQEMSSSIMEVADATKQTSSYMNEQVNQIHQTGSQTKAVAAIAEETSAGSQEVARVTLQQSKNMVVIDQLLKDLEKQEADLKQTIEQFSM